MNDGSRDRLSPGARELFRAARAEALPSSADRARSIDGLQALPSSSAALPPPTPLHRRTSGFRPQRIGGKMRLLLAAAAVFVTAGSLAAVLRLRSDRPDPIVPPVPLVERAAALRHAPKAAPLPAPVASSEAANPVVEPIADAPPAESRPPTASPSRNELKGDTRDDMNDELVLLGDARRALAAHQGATALRLLDEDRQRFPNSAFREERAYTRIRALCELGRSAEASADADRFLKKWPRSMYAAGVRRSCAFPSEGTPAADSVTGSRTTRH